MTLPQMAPIPEGLAGHRFPAGRYTITPEEFARVCAVSCVPRRSSATAHPIFGFVAALAGLGVSIEEICAICDFRVSDGPVVGACDITFHRPLRIGQSYDVSAEIVDFVRKASRRFGAVDHLALRVGLWVAEVLDCQVDFTWILPRGNAR